MCPDRIWPQRQSELAHTEPADCPPQVRQGLVCSASLAFPWTSRLELRGCVWSQALGYLSTPLPATSGHCTPVGRRETPAISLEQPSRVIVDRLIVSFETLTIL